MLAATRLTTTRNECTVTSLPLRDGRLRHRLGRRRRWQPQFKFNGHWKIHGHQVGVDEVLAVLLPADKVQAIETLVSKYGGVAMVGDGINDAPAMGRAGIGIAMGAAGSDAAVEAADIALMSDDLSKLPWLIKHSRRTLAIIRENITLSIGVKAFFVILTFSGHASLWSAIAADMGASLLVILNALRLLRGGPVSPSPPRSV